MGIYLLMSVLSCAMLKFSQHFARRWNAWGVLALALPCLLAAARGNAVGTDTEMYYDVYHMVEGLSLHRFITNNMHVEVMYYFFCRAGEWLTGVSTVFFLYQAISVGCLYDVASRYRHRIALWVVFMFYFAFFYSYSLNIMRQVAAVCYFLWLCSMLLHHRKIWLVPGLGVGVLIHNSVIFAAVMGVACWLVYRSRGYKRRFLMIAAVAFTAIGGYLLGEISTLIALIDIGNLSTYSSYFKNTSAYVGRTDSAVSILMFMVVVWGMQRRIFTPKLGYAGLMALMFQFALMQMGVYTFVLVRLSLYPLAFSILLMSAVLCSRRIDRFTRTVLKVSAAVMCFAYWYYTIVYNGTGEVIPYVFR